MPPAATISDVLSGVVGGVGGVAEGGGVGEAYVHQDAFRGVFSGMDLGQAVEVACGGVIGVWDQEVHPLPLGGYGGVDALQEILTIVEGAYHHGIGVVGAEPSDGLFIDEVRLVEAQDGGGAAVAGGNAGCGSIF